MSAGTGFAGDPGQQVGVRQIRAAAHIRRVRRRQGVDGSIGESAEDQVHLARCRDARSGTAASRRMRPAPSLDRAVPRHPCVRLGMRHAGLPRSATLAWIDVVSALQRCETTSLVTGDPRSTSTPSVLPCEPAMQAPLRLRSFPARSVFADHRAGGHRPEGRRHDRQGGAGRRSPTATSASATCCSCCRIR